MCEVYPNRQFLSINDRNIAYLSSQLGSKKVTMIFINLSNAIDQIANDQENDAIVGFAHSDGQGLRQYPFKCIPLRNFTWLNLYAT